MSAAFTRPERDLWAHLSQTDKPIFLYGMGDGADKILQELTKRNIPVKGVFASDEFVRGHSFRGFPVRRYSDARAEFPDMIALLCFAIDYEPMFSRLYAMDGEVEFYAPDVPVVRTDDRVFDLAFVKEHEAELHEVYAHLADEQSKQVFCDIVSYKLTGKIGFLKHCETEHKEAWDLLNIPQNAAYLDLGAYNGDTAAEFIGHAGGEYARVIAVEPDAKNYEKCCRRAEEAGWHDFEAHNCCAWHTTETLFFKGGRRGRGAMLTKDGTKQVQADTVDRIVNGRKIDFIKFDVEGAESRAIRGAEETIRAQKPVMEIAAYHKNEDLFAIPLQILAICPDYKVYLRHHPYIPAWETNYYFTR